MPFIIQKITAFIATDANGEEGIMAAMGQDNAWTPLIFADETRLEQIYPIAVHIREQTGQDFRVIQFSQREDITDETVAKYANKEPT